MRRTVGTLPSYGANTNYGARNFSNTILLLPALLLIKNREKKITWKKHNILQILSIHAGIIFLPNITYKLYPSQNTSPTKI